MLRTSSSSTACRGPTGLACPSDDQRTNLAEGGRPGACPLHLKWLPVRLIDSLASASPVTNAETEKPRPCPSAGPRRPLLPARTLLYALALSALLFGACGGDDAGEATDPTATTTTSAEVDPEDREGLGIATGDAYSERLAEIGEELAAANPDCAEFGLTSTFIEYFDEEIPEECRRVLEDFAGQVEGLEAPEQCQLFAERLVTLLRAFAAEGRDALFGLIDVEESTGLTFSETGARCFTNAVPTPDAG